LMCECADMQMCRLFGDWQRVLLNKLAFVVLVRIEYIR